MRLWRHQVELSIVFCSGEQKSSDLETKGRRPVVRCEQALVGSQCALSITSAAFSAII